MLYFFIDLSVSVQVSLLVVSNSLQPHRHSMPGFSVRYQLPELAQTHVHQVGDAIQPPHPLLSPSPPAFNLSPNQSLSNESVLHNRWPTYWGFSFSISPFNEYSELISLQSKGLSRVFSNTTVQMHQFFSTQLSLQSNSHIHT